ncbi:MAG: hypothetical protein M3N14_02580 [Bacteroidota bacterium]|nr:hypothetical protein [Bacteroidota bacterium]
MKQITRADKNVNLYYVENDAELNELSEIIAECDKVRLLNKLGHAEFYHEIRWSKDEALKMRDGVELASVDISQGEIAGFKVAGDWEAVSLLAEWDKGDAFKKLSAKAVKCASAMILFTVNDFDHLQLINAGEVIQRSWIYANQQGVSVHPMLSPAFFFTRLVHGKGEGIEPPVAAKLAALRARFLKIFPFNTKAGPQTEIFLLKVAIAEDLGVRSLRKLKSEVFIKE